MKSDEQLQFSNNVFIIPFLFVFIIWFVYWLEIKFGLNFNKFGVLPRNLIGFRGVFLSPFIHSGVKHLFNNSVPLVVLLASLFYFYKEVALKVVLYGGFLTGFLTWVIGRDSYHIGASGIVYLLFSFVFFSGVFKKHYRLVALSLIVIFLYGSMVWYVLPIESGISWEGHLSGFIFGLLFAYLYRKKGLVKEKFVFSKTEFDERFDENGNYIPPKTEEELPDDFKALLSEFEEKPIFDVNYKYVYKEEE